MTVSGERWSGRRSCITAWEQEYCDPGKLYWKPKGMFTTRTRSSFRSVDCEASLYPGFANRLSAAAISARPVWPGTSRPGDLDRRVDQVVRDNFAPAIAN